MLRSITLSPDFQKELMTIALPVSESSGTVLFREGEPVRGAFLIRSGAVRLSLNGGSTFYPARTLSAGDIAGLPATVSGEPYSLTAEVLNDCDLCFIPRPSLLNLMRRNPQAGCEIVRILSNEILLMRKAAHKLGASATR